MTIIQQVSQQIDSNVTIQPPEHISIDYEVNLGWKVTIDGEALLTTDGPEPKVRYFQEAGEPLQWLIDHHLVVTKAYNELQKACKKVSRKKKATK